LAPKKTKKTEKPEKQGRKTRRKTRTPKKNKDTHNLFQTLEAHDGVPRELAAVAPNSLPHFHFARDRSSLTGFR
jgi:hypothetical protein